MSILLEDCWLLGIESLESRSAEAPRSTGADPRVTSKVATRDINFGILIKVLQKVDLKIPYILKKLSKEILGFIFLCLFFPS